MARILAEQLEALAPEYPKEDNEVLDQYRELLRKDG